MTALKRETALSHDKRFNVRFWLPAPVIDAHNTEPDGIQSASGTSIRIIPS